MNMPKISGNGRAIGSSILTFVILLNLVALSFSIAATSPSAIYTALHQLCQTVNQFLAVAIMMMIILAAVTYAAGQIMGAETRARATVWATAMFTGAIFAAIIYLIVPWAINSITGINLSGACI